MMKSLLVAVLVALASLYVLDKILLWCESKGWIFYRKCKAGGSNTALMGMIEFLNPNASIVIEHLESEKRISYQVNDNEDINRLKTDKGDKNE